MKILVVKTSSMGDIIHALPVTVDIRENLPDAEVHWLSEESFKEIPALSPVVSKVHVCAFRRWRKNVFSAQTFAEVRALRTALASERYDVVIDEQGLLRSAWPASWTRSSVHGFSRDTVREPAAAFFYRHPHRIPEEVGAVKRYRLLAAETLGYEVPAHAPAFRLSPRAEALEVPEGPWVALAVNASRDEKLWPEDHWVDLGRSLLDEGRRSVFFWGNDKERERVERLARFIPDSVVAPRARLDRVAATLVKAEALVGVDTGLSHLAAALGLPTVGLYVSTPTEILHLVGDGPVRSLGNVGEIPTWREAKTALDAVRQEQKENGCSWRPPCTAPSRWWRFLWRASTSCGDRADSPRTKSSGTNASPGGPSRRARAAPACGCTR